METGFEMSKEWRVPMPTDMPSCVAQADKPDKATSDHDDRAEILRLRDQVASMKIAAWGIRHALERAIPYIAAQANSDDETASRQLKAAQAALAAFAQFDSIVEVVRQ